MSDQDFPPYEARVWGRDDWDRSTVKEMRARLDEIGPPWGNPKIPKALGEGYWIAYEALERLDGNPDRHPLSQRFHELLKEAGDLHDLKQADYGLDSDPFANVRASQAWGMPAWVGAMVRATDKVRRLQTFSRKGELKNESVVDAFMDLAVYALIARVLYEEDNDPTKETFA